MTGDRNGKGETGGEMGGNKVVQLDAREKRKRARQEAHRETRSVQEELSALPGFNPVLFGVEAGKWKPHPDTGLPDNCPVVPLGYDEESVYFLSARGTIAKLPANTSKGHIDLLFTPYKNFPVWAWPQRRKPTKDQAEAGKPGDVVGNFDNEKAKRDLFAAATRAGPWDPVEQVRGRGAWLLDPDPETETPARILLHLGDRLQIGNETARTGLYGEMIYPGAKPIPAPVPAGTPGIEGGTDGPGERLMSMLTTWNWMRGAVDAQLLLGWMACAFIGGALRWRPYVFLTGDQGAGKSFAIEFVEAVLGEGGLIKSEDATEAGVAQTLKHDSLPVLLDELENEGDPRRALNIIHMARRAASGTQKIRGGQDHTAASFTIRSCFMFAAINAPTMGPQDMARMAMLRLRPFPETSSRIKPDVREAAALGRALHRRVLDWFEPGADDRPAIDSVLDAFRAGLMLAEDKGGAGHNDRGADTFGFLLTGYWCAVHDTMPDEATVRELVAPLKKSELAEYEAITPEWLACWRHMLVEQPKALDRNTNKSVGAILDAYRAGPDADGIDAIAAKKQLASVGLALTWPRGTARTYENASLFVPISGSATAAVFDKTRWAAASREAAGAWTNALRGGPDPIIQPAQGRMGREKMRGTAIQIADLVGFNKGSKFFDPERDGEEEGDDA